MKMWRITNEGTWRRFSTDIVGNNIDEAIANFEEKEEKRGSCASREEIIQIQLLGDSNIEYSKGEAVNERKY